MFKQAEFVLIHGCVAIATQHGMGANITRAQARSLALDYLAQVDTTSAPTAETTTNATTATVTTQTTTASTTATAATATRCGDSAYLLVSGTSCAADVSLFKLWSTTPACSVGDQAGSPTTSTCTIGDYGCKAGLGYPPGQTQGQESAVVTCDNDNGRVKFIMEP